MRGAPPELVSDLTEALRAEAEASTALAAAKESHQRTAARTTSAVRELRRAGVPVTAIACMVARAWGLTPSVPNRKKIAGRLRTRLARDGMTRRNAEVFASSPEGSAPGLQSMREEEESTDMSQTLVKRVTTTETFLTEPDDEAAEDGAVGDLDEVDDNEDEDRRLRRKPAPRSRRR